MNEFKAIYDWSNFLKPNELEELVGSSLLLTYKKNEIIVKQGTLASQILVLEDGFAKLNFEESGKDTTFGFVTKGDFIGLMCSFVKKRLDFSAISLQTSIIRAFERDIFEKLIRENGDFAVHIVTKMSELINAAVHNLITLSHRNVNGAVATLLLTIEKVFKTHEFILPFTRQEMADTLGYSIESIINTLSDFHKDNMIHISGKNVKIINKKTLELIAEKG